MGWDGFVYFLPFAGTDMGYYIFFNDIRICFFLVGGISRGGMLLVGSKLRDLLPASGLSFGANSRLLHMGGDGWYMKALPPPLSLL